MSLIDLYNQTKSYQQVINTLNRLEELDGSRSKSVWKNSVCICCWVIRKKHLRK